MRSRELGMGYTHHPPIPYKPYNETILPGETVQVLEIITADLDEDQLEAVTSSAHQILVLASAGAGKTRVLTRRLAWLITHAPRAAFLAVTFTNKAADEMRERVQGLLQHVRLSWQREHVWISTFHRFCVRLLRRHGHHIGIPADFLIADEYQQRKIFVECLQARGLDPSAWSFRAFQRLRSAYAHPPPSLDKQWQAVWQDYVRRLRWMHALDFDDLQHEAIRLLESIPSLQDYYRAYFHTVLVDEFQDTNPPQYRLLRLLRGPDNAFFVVGDQDQSIYGFRGACPDHFRFLLRDYPQTRVLSLRTNYRTRARIVQAALQVITRDPARLPHEIRAQHDGGRVIVFGADNEDDEARWIRTRLVQLRRTLSDATLAVLIRARSQLPPIEKHLQQAGVPYVVLGLRSWWDSPPVRVVLDYLAFCQRPEVDYFFEAVYNVPPRGLGPRSLESLQARARGRSLWSTLEAAVQEDRSLPKAWSRFYQEMRAWMERRHRSTPVEWCRALIEHLQSVWRMDTRVRASYEARWRELLALVETIDTWEDLVEQLSLRSPDDRRIEDNRTPTYVMTVHAAKGLEFDYVVIPGAEDGLFPHALSRGEDEVREERRVFFVAITRARREVWITWARRRYGRRRRPSRFLSDLLSAWEPATDGVTVEGMQPGSLNATLKNSTRWFPQTAVSVEEEAAIQPGDLVVHAHYGRGVVRAVYGSGKRRRVRIWFFQGEQREFLLKRAPLRVLRSSPKGTNL